MPLNAQIKHIFFDFTEFLNSDWLICLVVVNVLNVNNITDEVSYLFTSSVIILKKVDILLNHNLLAAYQVYSSLQALWGSCGFDAMLNELSLHVVDIDNIIAIVCAQRFNSSDG